MKRNFTSAAFALALLLGSSASAHASYLVAYITADQIKNALVTGSSGTFGGIGSGNCAAAAGCGIYAIDFKAAAGVGTGSASTTTAAAYGASPTANWGVVTVLSDPNKGFEQLGTGTGVTGEELITANTSTSGKAGFTANNTGGTLAGLSAMATTTTFAFLLDFGASVVAPTSLDTLTFNVLGAQLGTSGANLGKQLSKGLTGVITLNNVTLYATPEPSSMMLVFGGIAAIGLGQVRRVRK
jgi:hypothetical protein